MENKINKIITLDDGEKYMIIDQGNYNERCYFLTSKLDNEDNLMDSFSIMEEIVENSEKLVSAVENKALLKALVDYFGKRVLIED